MVYSVMKYKICFWNMAVGCSTKQLLSILDNRMISCKCVQNNRKTATAIKKNEFHIIK